MATVSPTQADQPLVLALDLGTSSIRAVVYDRQGRAVDGLQSRTTYTIHTTPDGGSFADANEMWHACMQAIDELLQKAGPLAEQIAGVGMDTLVSNVCGLDENGQPITPVYTWADTRSAKQVEYLRSHLDEHATLDRTGVVQHTSYLPARFLWLDQTDHALFVRVRYWLSIGEYILLQLFGERRVSYSVASWTGLLNRHTLDWDEELLKILPIRRDQLSPLTDLSCAFTGMRREWAERWPALAKKPWFPACGDGVSSNIGSGGTGPAEVVVNLGTSGAMRVVITQTDFKLPWGLWCYRVDAKRSLLGGALSNGGNLFAWMNSTLQLPPPDALEAELSAMEPDSTGLTVLPFFAGERSTGWNPYARASIIGMTLNTKPIDIVRAGLESVAYRFALIYALLQPVLPDDHSFIDSGGALLNSPVWTQILTDTLGRPVLASAEPEATARGTALLTLESLGAIANVTEVKADMDSTCHPNMAAHETYKKAITRHREMYRLLVQ